MKILYINYIYQRGHLNFDHIHIDALTKQADDVKIILHKDIADQLPYDKTQYAMILPTWLNYDLSNGFVNRFFYILTLIWIKTHISFRCYDKVILSSMEEISLGLLPLCDNMYIICHDNARNTEDKVKGFFIQRLSRKNSFIVFNQQMGIPFDARGMRYYIVSHGCVKPRPHLSEEPLKIDVTGYRHIIFHPSNRPNEKFLLQLKESKRMQNFLEEQNILLIIGSLKPHEDISNHIVFQTKYLNHEEYLSLFLRSDIILLAYPDDFTNRVSGVSFECVAYNKLLLIRKNESLNYCCSFYNYQPMFDSIEQLEEKIKFLIENKNARCIVTNEDLHPNYQDILLSD